MRNLLLIILCLPMVINAYGQQDPQYTMYMFNRQALNPAYAGALEATNITLLGRAQWVGIPGGPMTSTVSANGYIGAIRSGIGGVVIGERLGSLQTFGATLNYAFHVSFSDRTKLNIGVQGGMYQKILAAKWLYNDELGQDPLIGAPNQEYRQGAFVGDLGAGLYFHVKRKNLASTAYPQDMIYVGLSAGHLLEPKLEKLLNQQGIGQDSRLRRSFNFTVGGTIPLSQNIYLAPSAFFRTDMSSWQLDLTANLYVSPMVFGVNYRSNLYRNHDSVSGILGFNATTNLFIAYSYDYTVSALSRFTSGSHELIISYTFPTLTKLLPPIHDVRGLPD